MAKKKAARANAKAVAFGVSPTGQHTCASYKLTVANANEAFRFELNVVGDDGQQYFLRVKVPDDRPKLVQSALTTIAKYWPEYNWPFSADENNSIVDIG